MEPLTPKELSSWSKCKMYHQWRYQAGKGYGLRPLRVPASCLAQRLVHYLLAQVAITKIPTMVSLSQWIKDNVSALQQNDADVQHALYRAYGVVQGYVDQYPEEQEMEWGGIETGFDVQYQGIRIRGGLDCYYEKGGQLVLREHKYWTWKREWPWWPLHLPMQTVIRATALYEITNSYPDVIEYNVLWPPKIRRKVGESLEQYVGRCRKASTFERFAIPHGVGQLQHAWEKIVVPKVLSIHATMPYVETDRCWEHESRCEYFPLCECLLSRQEIPPELVAQYVVKEEKHEE